MSAMVISSVKRFIEMSPRLEYLGIENIHFYNSAKKADVDAPMVALVPFVDFVILGKDANLAPYFVRIVDEAVARHIPVLSEECINNSNIFLINC